MSGRAALLLAATASLWGGCNHDPLPALSSDGGMPDLAGAPDLADPACRTHQILSVPINDIRHPSPIERVGSSIVLGITYSLRDGCDVLGDVSVRVMPGNATDFVVITVRVWRGSNDCGPPVTAYRVVTLGPELGLSNPMLLVSDGAPGGTRMLHLQLVAGIVPDCSVPRGRGQACDGDCQCQRADPPSRCVHVDGAFSCQITCAEDVDCRGKSGEVNLCDAAHRCIHCLNDCCWAGGCPFGQSCAAGQGVCGPIAGLPPARCSCDSDCGTGRLCTQGGTCVIPCTTLADCPHGSTQCDGGRCSDF